MHTPYFLFHPGWVVIFPWKNAKRSVSLTGSSCSSGSLDASKGWWCVTRKTTLLGRLFSRLPPLVSHLPVSVIYEETYEYRLHSSLMGLRLLLSQVTLLNSHWITQVLWWRPSRFWWTRMWKWQQIKWWNSNSNSWSWLVTSPPPPQKWIQKPPMKQISQSKNSQEISILNMRLQNLS